MTDADTTNSEQAGQAFEDAQKERMVRYLYWGGFVFLCLFGVFASVSFYTSVMEIINIWIAADFKPVFRMLFNLLIILLTLLGLSVLVRRLDIPIEG